MTEPPLSEDEIEACREFALDGMRDAEREFRWSIEEQRLVEEEIDRVDAIFDYALAAWRSGYRSK